MATILTHALIPIAITAMVGRRYVSWRLFFWGCVVSLLPDADVLGFKFGIAYGDQFGHRGFTHSLFFAIFIASLGALFSRYLQAPRLGVFWFFLLSCASHPLLDALTNGGHGVAFAWPLTDTRYFFPWQFIEVSPIGLRNFLTIRGATVLASEARVVWLPLLALLLIVWLTRLALKWYERFSYPVTRITNDDSVK